MKNIHLLPTDKPSRLYEDVDCDLRLGYDFIVRQGMLQNQHIYITSDEEIKEGDWIKWGEAIYKANRKYIPPFKKIILTTDQDLIADGVQAIDDEFLEWFVKNPSCEFVEVKKVDFEVDMGLGDECIEHSSYYKTIIPQEEPKQENCCTPIGQIKRYKDCIGCDRKPKQETLEESAKNYAESTLDNDPVRILSFIKGAEWKEEQIPSIIEQKWLEYRDNTNNEDAWCFKEWLVEQFKNK